MDPAVLRDDMVEGLVHESKGYVRSERVATAMRAVPREPFVEDESNAYTDTTTQTLGTTVLAPSMAGRLLEALDLRPDDDVLVVGCGVGYTAAVVAEVVGDRHVHAIDIARRLVWEARSNLGRAGYDGVLVDRRDGAEGLPEYAPYDRILLEAAAIEPPQSLVAQLGADGRLVMPLGAQDQHLAVVDEDGTHVDDRGPVAFTPMLLEGEQSDALERNRTHREDREHADRAAQSHTGWERDWIDWD